jgi:thiol-disulfide isomerase/thioredoxin
MQQKVSLFTTLLGVVVILVLVTMHYSQNLVVNEISETQSQSRSPAESKAEVKVGTELEEGLGAETTQETASSTQPENIPDPVSEFKDFSQSEYEAAVAEGKFVVLFFYANWCPYCKMELPEAVQAFASLKNDQVVGFIVNYKDNETENAELAIAKKFGVAYQHTKVFIKNGESVGKFTSSWDAPKYYSEISNYLK